MHAYERGATVELDDDKVPDESTILRFRHLLEKHGLTEGIFEVVKDLLAEHRLLLRAGTIVDATIIAAPSSTKNATKTRDPEMKDSLLHSPLRLLLMESVPHRLLISCS